MSDSGPQAHWLAPVLVALIGAFMSILDSSIVNVAIPTIMNVFNASTDSVQWVSTVYMLALGVVSRSPAGSETSSATRGCT